MQLFSFQSSNDEFWDDEWLELKAPIVEMMFEKSGAPTCVWKIDDEEEGAQGA